MMGPQQIWPARAVVDPVIECQTGDHHEVVPATSQDRGGQPYLRSMRPDGERQANEEGVAEFGTRAAASAPGLVMVSYRPARG